MKSPKVLIVIGLVAVLAALLLYYPQKMGEEPKIPAGTTSIELIENFYRQYLAADNQGKLSMHLPFSESFQHMIEQNNQLCQEKAKEDVCGWASDGFVYLNIQEVDPALNFANSNFKISSPSPTIVDVEIDIQPSAKRNTEYSKRKFRYLMKLEDDRWVVDDVLQNGVSARQLMQEEKEFYTAPENEEP